MEVSFEPKNVPVLWRERLASIIHVSLILPSPEELADDIKSPKVDSSQSLLLCNQVSHLDFSPCKGKAESNGWISNSALLLSNLCDPGQVTLPSGSHFPHLSNKAIGQMISKVFYCSNTLWWPSLGEGAQRTTTACFFKRPKREVWVNEEGAGKGGSVFRG